MILIERRKLPDQDIMFLYRLGHIRAHIGTSNTQLCVGYIDHYN